MNELVQYVTIAALLVGAVSLTAIIVAVGCYLVMGAIGLVMLWRQARGEFEPDDETGDEE